MTYTGKKLTELTFEECKELLQHDENTREYCINYIIDNAMFWAEEITKYAPRCFEIEFDNYRELYHVNFTRFEDCTNWLKDIL